MRSREDIEAEIAQVPPPALSPTERLVLEIWLDIRDLLQKPPVENVASDGRNFTLQPKRVTSEEKTYVFTREVKAWGVEEGDYYNPQRHMYQGGTEKLLAEGVIEEEEQFAKRFE